MVYVLSNDGKPLMPTSRHKKVRLWLKEGKAIVVRRFPFTIQLLSKTLPLPSIEISISLSVSTFVKASLVN
jgi:hypothetical protein